MGFKSKNGFSLIEVLISLILLSLVLLGLDAAQVYAYREAKLAYFFNIASNQLNNGAERLQALQSYIGLDEQIMAWNAENKRLLPQGFGTIAGEFPNYWVILYWGEMAHHCTKSQMGLSGCLKKKIQVA